MNNLVWFTNNLRVDDNAALTEACKKQGKVMGIYCFDPRHFELNKYGFKKTERFRTKFLLESVRELSNNLLKKNISLLVYFDTPENVFKKVVSEHAIGAVFLQNEWTSEEVNVIESVKKLVPNVVFNTFYDQFLFHPNDIPYSNIQSLPQVFTVFRKEC
ncbi:MAG TPA: DASH family cryptochrome, partial [Flavobacterium sp.]|nr:DASH family cryptochrome [Flavobacterium sp.]